MSDILCWLCYKPTYKKDVMLRSKKSSVINCCDDCEFEFFTHDNQTLLSQNQLDKTRLESAGLDIPKMAKDFENGYQQAAGYINEYIKDEDNGCNILEIGCSWGYFLKRLQDSGCVPYGIEINPVRADYVKESLGLQCFTNVDEAKSKNIKFKKIFSFYCLEYINNPIQYFTELMQMLENNGEIIFVTPNLRDVLKDIWESDAYKNFFYDECAVAYYSLQSVKKLLEKLQHINSKIKFDIKTRQGYSLYNHIHWHFNHRPLNNNTLVGGDKLTDILQSVMNIRSELGGEVTNLIHEFSEQYKKVIETHNYGNQIILRLQT